MVYEQQRAILSQRASQKVEQAFLLSLEKICNKVVFVRRYNFKGVEFFFFDGPFETQVCRGQHLPESCHGKHRIKGF